jgi:hypothetical protein
LTARALADLGADSLPVLRVSDFVLGSDWHSNLLT